MPTYQYSCTECGHFMEVVQSFSDDSLTVCPECEGRLRKVFNAVGVVFKGSGFYRNDSRGPDTSGGSDTSGKAAKPEKSEKSEKSGGSEKSSTSTSSDTGASSSGSGSGSTSSTPPKSA